MNEFDFPFEPYEQQKKLMATLYDNIMKSINTAYESPTGTGKSLMILSVIKKYIYTRFNNNISLKQVTENESINVPVWIQQQYDQIIQNQHKQEIDAMKSLQQYLSHIQVLPLDTIKLFDDYVQHLIDKNDADEQQALQFDMQISDLFSWKLKINSIIFASRTHSQLEQFNQIARQHSDLQMITLASRATYCIHERTKDIEDVDIFCQNNRATCIYFKNYRMLNALIKLFKKHQIIRMNPRELKDFAKQHSTCPYYVSKLLQYFVDVSLVTHAQLLSMETEDMESSAGQLIIIDECHNMVEQICQNSQQKLKIIDIIIMLLLVNKYIVGHQNYLNLKDLKLLIKLQDFLCQVVKICLKQLSEKPKCFLSYDLVAILKQYKLNDIYNDVIDFIKENNYVHRIRQKLNQNTFYQLLNFLKLLSQPNIYDYMLIFDNQYDSQQENNIKKYIQNIIKIFGDKITTLTDLQEYLFDKQPSTIPFNLQTLFKNTDLLNTTIELTQLQPQFDFNENASKFNIHMLGGTISPFSNFKTHFNFPLQFAQFGHVISPEQLKISIVTQVGQDDQFKFTYQQFENTQVYNDLLKHFIIIRYQKLKPEQNMIVFVPNYQVLRRFKSIVETNLDSILSKKILYQCQQDQKLMTTFEEPGISLETIQQNCKVMKNHILFGIANGSLAEGIDFKDDLCRQLIVLGIPMPNMKSVYVQEKLKIDSDYAIIKAFKTINQCIGRAIRWKGDWSNVLLIDLRYVRYFNQWLSQWIQDSGYSIVKW